MLIKNLAGIELLIGTAKGLL